MADTKGQTEFGDFMASVENEILDKYAAFIVSGSWSDVQIVRDSLARVNDLTNGLVRNYDTNCRVVELRVHKPRGRAASEPKPMTEREAMLAKLGLK
jgi:hypothetical protein